MSVLGHRRGQAATARDAADPSLRGRTQAIPFEDVWQAALRLTGGGLSGWTLVASDDHAGMIKATAKRMTGALYDVRIEITLDENGQTRVDGVAMAHKPSTDFGSAARLLRRFFRALDRVLARRGQRTHANST